MKKLLISLTILFSIFVGINSVSAEENTLIYDSSSPLEYLTMTNTINLSDAEVTTLMQSVGYSTDLIDKYLLRRNYALNNNKNDKFYFVNPGIANSFYSDRIFINMAYEEINQAWLEISEKLTYGYTDLYLNIQSKYTYDYTYYYFDFGTSVSSNSSAWLSSNSNFASIKYNSNTKVLDNNKISRNYFFETNMKGNISFKKGSFGNVSSIIIDDITYSLNDTLPITLEDGYHSLKEQNYKYNQEIDTTNLSYIKISYDTTKTNYEDYNLISLENLSTNLKEAYIEKSWNWGVCIDENTCYDNYIYRNNLNYLQTQNMYYILSTFKYEDIEHGFYEETQDLNYYYAYFDVSNISDTINLYIDSKAPFTIEFGELEDYEDNFIKLNLKNYSGIVLFPISNKYNGDYLFYLDNAKIDIYEYKDDKLINKYENSVYKIFKLENMEYYMRNRYYLIENKKKNEDSYISFDTKYFVYKLVKNETDDIIIKNPNTNQDQNINSIYTTRETYNLNDINSTLDLFSSRSYLTGQAFKNFSEIWNKFKQDTGIYTYLLMVVLSSIALLLIKAFKK